MSTRSEAHSEKQIALEAWREMPEGATLQDISEEMAILATIHRGEAAADEGRLVSHEEVKRRLAAWVSNSAGWRRPRSAC